MTAPKALLLGLLAAASAAADPATVRIFTAEDAPAGLAPLFSWLHDARRGLEGRPAEAWPRVLPSFASLPTRGSAFLVFVPIMNLGSAPFEGTFVARVPETGFEARGGIRLVPQGSLSPPLPVPALPINPWEDAGPSLVILQLIIDVPEQAPGEITLQVATEIEGTVMGEPLETRYAVDSCAARPVLLHTLGLKRIVWGTWDAPMYSITFCNPTSESITAAYLIYDLQTGRPIMDVASNAVLPFAIARGFPETAHLGGASSNVALIPAGYVSGVTFRVDTAVLPVNATPVIDIAWGNGRTESLRGDSLTYARVAIPRLPDDLPIG